MLPETPDEIHALLCGKRVAAGALLYEDVWYAGAPVMVWLYAAFFKVFGTAALWMLRLCACLYLYLCAVYFNYFLLEFRPFQRLKWLPAIILVMLESLPVSLQTIHSGLVMLLPLLYTAHVLTRMGEEGVTPLAICFKAGLSIAFCLFTDYIAIGLLLGFLLLYIRLTSPRIDVFFAILGGALTGIAAVVLYFHFSGSLNDWWDQSVLYYIDEKYLTGNFLYPIHPMQTFSVILLSWGVVFLMAIAGFIHFRLRFFTYLRSVRNVEIAMSTWAIIGVLSLLVSYKRVELYDFLVISPPMIFYFIKFCEFAKVQRYWALAMSFALIMPVVDVFSYSPKKATADHNRILYFMQKVPAGETWLLDNQLGLYLYLDTQSTLKYMDFRMAYYKLACFGATDSQLISQIEPDIAFFKEFQAHKPTYIIDSQHAFFPKLRNRYPTLFDSYKSIPLGNYVVYIAR